MRESKKAPIQFDVDNPDLTVMHKSILRLLKSKGEMTALDVGTQLNRSRGIMNIRLNQLVRLGLVQKVKRGRKYFYTAK